MDARPDFAVVADAARVEAWSVRRLPFEARGPMLEFRKALRAGLEQLDASGGRLRCVYSSAATDLCDAENVLLYNVGMSSFRSLTSCGLTFERAHVVPPALVPLNAPAMHHHLYETSATTEILRQSDGLLAAWEGPIPDRTDKAAHWWWATHTASRALTKADRPPRTFAIRIEFGGITRPTSTLVKPMLDGVISAFHRDPSPAAETLRRLSLQLGREQALVHRQLVRPDTPLGERTLVRTYRDGLQWNPADDLCVACSVENHGPASPPVARGQLVAIS